MKRHYETEHKSFEQTYPLKSELRAQKIKTGALRSHRAAESGGWVRKKRGRERKGGVKAVQLLNCVETACYKYS